MRVYFILIALISIFALGCLFGFGRGCPQTESVSNIRVLPKVSVFVIGICSIDEDFLNVFRFGMYSFEILTSDLLTCYPSSLECPITDDEKKSLHRKAWKSITGDYGLIVESNSTKLSQNFWREWVDILGRQDLMSDVLLVNGRGNMYLIKKKTAETIESLSSTSSAEISFKSVTEKEARKANHNVTVHICVPPRKDFIYLEDWLNPVFEALRRDFNVQISTVSGSTNANWAEDIFIGVRMLPKHWQDKIGLMKRVFFVESERGEENQQRHKLMEQGARVFTFTEAMAAKERENNAGSIFYLPYIPPMISDPPKRDREKICFIGWNFGRRKVLIDKIEKHVSITMIGKDKMLIGEERDRKVMECGILINIHSYENKYFEYLRVIPAWVNGIDIVSESCNKEDEKLFGNTVSFYSYETFQEGLLKRVKEIRKVRDLDQLTVANRRERVKLWKQHVDMFDLAINEIKTKKE